MRFFILILLISTVLLCSCTGNSNITSPSPGSNITFPEFNSAGILVEQIDRSGNPVNGIGLMGISRGYIDPDTMTGELAPLRQVSIDDALEIVDITNYLSLVPCTDCVKMMGISMDTDSNIVARIGIKHPFDVGDPTKPITGRNRGDLHVFNIEGTVLFENTTNITFGGLEEVITPVYLANADGYSPYLDTIIDGFYPTDATLHPYILHFDDYTEGNYNAAYPMGFQSVTNPPPSGNLVMPMGSDYDIQDYVFSIPDSETLEFIFAVGCTYAISASSMSLRFMPEYQVPQHNKKAASEVSVDIAYNGLAAGDTGSSADLNILVLDINHGVPVGAALNEMLADSSVSEISVEIPGVTNGIVTGTPTPVSGNGRDPADPLLFEVTVFNDEGADLGTYAGLIKVTDNYMPNMNLNPVLEQKDGIARVPPGVTPLQGLFNIDEFATYQYMEITVGEVVEQPIWSTSQGDIANTGRIGYRGPQSVHNAPTWEAEYPPGWNFYGNPLPVFYNETTLFVCTTGDGGPLPCYAIDIETKTLKWSQQFHDDMQNWLNIKCLNADGTIVLTVETKYDRMVALDAETGDFLWELPGMVKVDSYPTLDLDGNFIVPLEDVGIQSIEPVSGVVNWTANIGDTYYNTPATGASGVIYTMDGGQWDCTLKALDPSDGSVNWDSGNLGGHRGMGVTVHPNQSILASGEIGLFCFQDDDDSYTVLWQQPYGCPFYGSPAIGQDDDIYVLDYDDQLRRLDPATGDTITSTGDWGYGNSARLAIGSDGLIYTKTYLYDQNEAYMSCFNPDCTLRWRHLAGQWFMGDGHYGAPAIGMDGSLYSCYRPWGSCGWHDDDL